MGKGKIKAHHWRKKLS